MKEELQNIQKLRRKEAGLKLFLNLKYKKYFRKTSLKQKNIGDLFLDIIQKKNPKTFLEIGIFHGVTARNVCELMFKNHGDNFNYIGIDIFYNSNLENRRLMKVYLIY